jgi:CDP-alcohol phosphatidyltransferase
MNAPQRYSYAASVKSDISDEPVNVFLQRPIAGLVTRLVFSTSMTPNQLTLISTLCGCVGATIAAVSPRQLWASGLLLYAKDIFDSADGQLARAKQLNSRRGRFYDSIGDYVVNLFLFSAIGYRLFDGGISLPLSLLIGTAGFLGVTLRVSYHVYYQTSFLHTEDQYSTNRVSEEIAQGDSNEDFVTGALHRLFLLLYGWQDRLMQRIDLWCYRNGGLMKRVSDTDWYRNAIALRIGGFIGYGTEFVVLTLCFIAGSLEAYLFCTLVIFNLIWGGAVLYRRIIVS